MGSEPQLALLVLAADLASASSASKSEESVVRNESERLRVRMEEFRRSSLSASW